MSDKGENTDLTMNALCVFSLRKVHQELTNCYAVFVRFRNFWFEHITPPLSPSADPEVFLLQCKLDATPEKSLKTNRCS